jgi:hypothetical protein
VLQKLNYFSFNNVRHARKEKAPKGASTSKIK